MHNIRMCNKGESLKPVIKWAGGKSSLAPTFDKRGYFPLDFQKYYEPFTGSAAIYLYLYKKKKIKKGAVLVDLNKELIDLYRVIRSKTKLQRLIEELNSLQSEISKEDYLEKRKEFNLLKVSNEDIIRKSALMIYLNKTCYNGLYRENLKGEFNVPFGKYSKVKLIDETNLHSISKALKDVKLIHMDYYKWITHSINKINSHDFVYFDPPYIPTSQTSSFTSYTGGGFGSVEQSELAEIIIKLFDKGVYVLLSNSYVPLEIDKLYNKPGIQIFEVDAQRYISCKGDGRKITKEYAITTFDPMPLKTLYKQKQIQEY